MKICLVAELFYPNLGGGEKYLFEMAQSLAEEGHQVKVLTSWKSGRKERLKLNERLEVYYFDWREISGHPYPKNQDLEKYWVWADVIHTSLYTAALATFWRNLSTAKNRRKPLVLTVFEVIDRDWWLAEKNWFKAVSLYLFEKLCINLPFQAFLPISEATKQSLSRGRFLKPKINEVIYPVVSCEVVKTKAKIKNYYLYYGRPGQTKGVYILLRAIKALIEKQSDYGNEFHLVLGLKPASEREKIVDFIKNEKLEKRVKVFEPLDRDELNRKIVEAKAVIVPSLTEGFGYSAFEACQKNKLVIVSKACSLPEVVFGKIIFFERNNEHSLCEAILAADQNHYQEIKKPVRICDGQHTFNQLTTVYQRVIRKS